MRVALQARMKNFLESETNLDPETAELVERFERIYAQLDTPDAMPTTNDGPSTMPLFPDEFEFPATRKEERVASKDAPDDVEMDLDTAFELLQGSARKSR